MCGGTGVQLNCAISCTGVTQGGLGDFLLIAGVWMQPSCLQSCLNFYECMDFFKLRPKLILETWLWCVSVCLADAVCTSGRWGMCGLWISFNLSSQLRSDKNQHTQRFYCCFKTSTVVLLMKFLLLQIFYCKFIYLFSQNSYSCKTSDLWNHIAHFQQLVLIFLRRTK